MTHEADIRVLNDLVEVTLDSAEGYHEASDHAKAPSLKALFVARATERRAIVADLQAQVRRLGGAPEDERSVLARAHRVFLDLKSALGGGTGAVLSEVERGEDHIKRRYEDALAERGVSLEVQNAIQTHYATIRGGVGHPVTSPRASGERSESPKAIRGEGRSGDARGARRMRRAHTARATAIRVWRRVWGALTVILGALGGLRSCPAAGPAPHPDRPERADPTSPRIPGRGEERRSLLTSFRSRGERLRRA